MGQPHHQHNFQAFGGGLGGVVNTGVPEKGILTRMGPLGGGGGGCCQHWRTFLKRDPAIFEIYGRPLLSETPIVLFAVLSSPGQSSIKLIYSAVRIPRLAGSGGVEKEQRALCNSSLQDLSECKKQRSCH